MSKRDDWEIFQLKVYHHITDYVDKQYNSPLTYSTAVSTLKKYVERIDKNARPGEQLRDFLKIAHCSQMAYDQYTETPVKEKPLICKHCGFPVKGDK